jgi:hypothetical protein
MGLIKLIKEPKGVDLIVAPDSTSVDKRFTKTRMRA